MGKRSIVDRIKDLKLPDHEYIVIGSGVMDAIGIRESQDIDLVLAPSLFNKLLHEGWRQEIVHDELRLMHDDAEAWLTWSYRGEQLNMSQLMEHTITIQGILFVSPEFLKNWKSEKKRPKDIADIELLEAHINYGS